MQSIRHLCFRVLILLTSLLLINGVGEGQRARLSPRAILQKMAQNYASCSSYQDTGIVETTYYEGMGGRIEKMPFKTYFKRPNLFRFEWVDYFLYKDGRKSIVWSDGKETFTYWEPDTYEKDRSLESGIAGATGVSRGAAATISSLLFSDSVGFILTDLTSLSLTGEENFEGEVCYRISGKHPLGSIYELWIGKRDFLVRKVRTRSTRRDEETVQEEIHRNIKISQPVQAEVFNFKPPIPLSASKQPDQDLPPLSRGNPAWSEFVSEEGRFKVLLPGKPTTQTLTLETPKGRVTHHGFTALSLGTICVIDYADLPKEALDPANLKLIFDETRDEMLKTLEGKLASETAISLDGHQGREVKINLRGGEAVVRFYIVNERFYELGLIQFNSLKEDSGEGGKFFESFKITGMTKPIASLFLKSPEEIR